MLPGVGDDGGLVELSAGLAHDEGLAHLTEPLVGYADHRAVRDAVQPGQHLLDLGRIHVEAAADVHVLEPVGDPEIAVLVECPDVAGVQPAVGVDGRRGGLGIVEVAEHHVGTAQQHLTRAVGDPESRSPRWVARWWSPR